MRLQKCADNKLIADCVKLVAFNPSTTIILVLGDKDFASSICILRSLGKKVIIFAQRGNASQKLIKIVSKNNFHFIDELPELVKQKKQSQAIYFTSKKAIIHI
ncbi:MAG: hypothetical protein C4323_22525 [Mastigocladus sp. ERB_26_2]